MINQIKLHVGYVGKTRDGKRVEIESMCGNMAYRGDNGRFYWSDGNINVTMTQPDDIVGPWADPTAEPEYNNGILWGWVGGQCPVHPEMSVECVLSDGSIISEKASNVNWERALHPNTVVAFRVVENNVDLLVPQGTTTDNELIPCPFCGSDDLVEGGEMFCNGCGASGPSNMPYPFVQRDWNTRAAPSLGAVIELPEVQALCQSADKVANWTIGGMLVDDPKCAEQYPLLCAEILSLRTALAALTGT